MTKEIREILNKKINEIEFLSTRVINVLDYLQIKTFNDLVQHDEYNFLKIPKFGKKGLEEIKEILQKHNLKLGSYEYQLSDIEDSQEVVKEIKSKEQEFSKDLFKKVQELPFSVRSMNYLKNNKIFYVGELVQKTELEMIGDRNFGRRSLNEVKEVLNTMSLHLGMKILNWSQILEQHFDKEILDQKIEDTKNQIVTKGINKSLFKNFPNFIKNHNRGEILINKKIDSLELEKLIIKDIDEILLELTDKINFLFKARYGYKETCKTLENIGKKFDITRERVRQLESSFTSNLKILGRVNKNSLIEYFNQYEVLSFEKLFPNLSKNFSNTAIGSEDIARSRLVIFMENYCGVSKGYFKTIGRELWNFDKEKLIEIFSHVPSGVSYENFIETIKENYGYNTFVAKSSIKFMESKNLIKLVNNKIYVVKIRKYLEVNHILLDFPEGLHWKKIFEIGNKSYTANKWDLDRIVGDYSINVNYNSSIYLCERGTFKLLKYCSEINNRDKIIDFFINYLKKNNKVQMAMEIIYKEAIKEKEFNNLNFYDARAIIKIFGQEKGIFHSGKSGTNTISLNKKIELISLKDKIKDIVLTNTGEINRHDIIKKIQKTDEVIPIDTSLNDLVDEMKIFRISPGTYLNFDDAIKLCDKDEVKSILDKKLNNYEFITNGFIRETINDDLGFNLSNFYYDTLSRILAKENNWFYGSNYLSKKKEKKMNVDRYIKDNYDENLSTNENFEEISKKIGISKLYFANIVYQSKVNFNTDWIHRDD